MKLCGPELAPFAGGERVACSHATSAWYAMNVHPQRFQRDRIGRQCDAYHRHHDVIPDEEPIFLSDTQIRERFLARHYHFGD